MKKVMVIGGGILQVPVIKKVKELGYEAICVDRDKNAIGFKFSDQYAAIDIVDEKKCFEFATQKKIDGVLTVATDYGVLTSSYISEKMGLKGLAYDVCKVIKNKYKVRESFKQNNLMDLPQYYEVEKVSDVVRFARELNYPIIVKPTDGSGSRGVSIVENHAKLRKSVEMALKSSISKKAIIESFVRGKEYGVEIFVNDGEVNILAILEKTMTEPPIFAELGHAVVTDEYELTSRITKVVVDAIKALNINFGSVNMDILVDDEQVVIVDIGARAGGNLISSHIVPLSTNIDLYGNSIKACLGQNIEFECKSNLEPIATRILNLKAGIVKKIDYEGIEELKKLDFVKDIILNISQNSTVTEYRNNLDSCGYVVVSGENKEDAKQKALYIRNRVEEVIEILEEDKAVCNV